MSEGFDKKLFDIEVEMPHEEIQKLIKGYAGEKILPESEVRIAML